jgi:hypothetical protein
VSQNDRNAQIDVYKRMNDPRIRFRVDKAKQAAEIIAMQKRRACLSPEKDDAKFNRNNQRC